MLLLFLWLFCLLFFFVCSFTVFLSAQVSKRRVSRRHVEVTAGADSCDPGCRAVSKGAVEIRRGGIPAPAFDAESW